MHEENENDLDRVLKETQSLAQQEVPIEIECTKIVEEEVLATMSEEILAHQISEMRDASDRLGHACMEVLKLKAALKEAKDKAKDIRSEREGFIEKIEAGKCPQVLPTRTIYDWKMDTKTVICIMASGEVEVVSKESIQPQDRQIKIDNILEDGMMYERLVRD